MSRAQAWREAERFGGKYIYSCPVGLTCIATPVQTELDLVANITVGPFLMVDEEDFVQCELESRAKDEALIRKARQALRSIPRVSPEQAEPIARQLFLSVGGIGKSFRIGDLLTRQSTDRLMGDLSDFTESEKLAETLPKRTRSSLSTTFWKPSPLPTAGRPKRCSTICSGISSF